MSTSSLKVPTLVRRSLGLSGLPQDEQESAQLEGSIYRLLFALHAPAPAPTAAAQIFQKALVKEYALNYIMDPI